MAEPSVPETARARKRDLTPFTGMTRRWFVRFEWKPQDLWIGLFWRRNYPWTFDVWVCVLPMVPLHFGWEAQIRG